MTISTITSIVEAASLLLGVIAAWATLIFIQRRTLHSQWVDGFRQIYAEFWKDPDISKVRRWITSDREYEALKAVLIARLKTEGNQLDAADNEMIDGLDRFIALLVRVKSFDTEMMNDDQRQLWNALYERFWIAKIYSRPEVAEYIRRYWTYLYDKTYTQAPKTDLSTGTP